MGSGRRPWPSAIAALGAAGLLVSLWLPWYWFTIPSVFINQAEGLASQFGVLGPLITQGAEIARHLGALHVSGWRVLNQIDIVLALVAGVAGGTSLLSPGERVKDAGRLIAGAGTVALVLCAYRAAVPPGPSGLLHPAAGLYVALGCSVAVLVGGLLASGEEGLRPGTLSDVRALHPSAPRSRSRSVAPPTGSLAPPGS